MLPALGTHAPQRGQKPRPDLEASCAEHTVHRQPVAAPATHSLSDCVLKEGGALGTLL